MQRLTYLDNLRTACMLLGVFVHTLTLGEFGRLGLIVDVSSKFRMATFFAISGFFAAMLLHRRGVSGLLRNRLQALALPLAAGLVILNPLALWLVFHFHTREAAPASGWAEVSRATFGDQAAFALMNWHLHLWFLISLLLFVLATPLLAPLLRRAGESRAAARLAAFRGGLFVPLALALGVAAWTVLALVALRIAGRFMPDYWLLRASLMYLPFFALGLLLFASPALWDRVRRADAPLLACIVILALAERLAPLPDVLSALLSQIGTALLRCWICFALLGLFARFFDRSTPLAAALSRSIYTIYLFHYLIIYGFATFYAAVLPIDAAAFWVIALATILAGYLLHILVIEKIPLLGFVFNGKPIGDRFFSHPVRVL